jgi:hypothetical protein
MKMRKLLWIVALAASVQGASADAVDEPILAQLKAQGFTEIEVETSWLGRRVIEARRADGRREIVLNPRTGEILRDTWIATSGSGAGGTAGRSAILDPVAGPTSGKSSAESSKGQGSATPSRESAGTSSSAGTSASASSGSFGSGSSNGGSSNSGSGKSGTSEEGESGKAEKEDKSSGKEDESGRQGDE